MQREVPSDCPLPTTRCPQVRAPEKPPLQVSVLLDTLTATVSLLLAPLVHHANHNPLHHILTMALIAEDDPFKDPLLSQVETTPHSQQQQQQQQPQQQHQEQLSSTLSVGKDASLTLGTDSLVILGTQNVLHFLGTCSWFCPDEGRQVIPSLWNCCDSVASRELPPVSLR